MCAYVRVCVRVRGGGVAVVRACARVCVCVRVCVCCICCEITIHNKENDARIVQIIKPLRHPQNSQNLLFPLSISRFRY